MYSGHRQILASQLTVLNSGVSLVKNSKKFCSHWENACNPVGWALPFRLCTCLFCPHGVELSNLKGCSFRLENNSSVLWVVVCVVSIWGWRGVIFLLLSWYSHIRNLIWVGKGGWRVILSLTSEFPCVLVCCICCFSVFLGFCGVCGMRAFHLNLTPPSGSIFMGSQVSQYPQRWVLIIFRKKRKKCPVIC